MTLKLRRDWRAPRTPRATHQGTLTFGSVAIACAVLADRRRIVNARDLARMFGSSGGDERSVLRSLVPDLADQLDAPIEYRARDGTTAYGYEATLLPQICKAIVVAAERGEVRDAQRGAVDVAARILAVLIDEGRRMTEALP